jgi:hypothetical protein
VSTDGPDRRRRRIRAALQQPLRLPSASGRGEWDFVHLLDSFQLPTVGETIFSPLPLLGFCELLAGGVEETAASKSRRAAVTF